MPITPEDLAREKIDAMLAAAGWAVQNRDQVSLMAASGVAVREFPLKTGAADYLLFVDGMAAGVVEAKREGTTLTGVEIQTTKYSEGLPPELPCPRRPLPFLYQSTGVETRFTSLLEPDARSRNVFWLHRPETLGEWLTAEIQHPGSTLRAKLRHLPELISEGLRPAQITAIRNLETSLAENRPRALIQMASGGGKTFAACNFIYRLIKHGGARRVLFLVDRGNLGRQTLKEFQSFRTPEELRLFTELYNVQHMQSNKLDDVSKVCITTIQRLYSMLKGEPEFDPALEEDSGWNMATLLRHPPPVDYNPRVPVETFDFIVTDECHRSIYHLWRQVLEYFDAFLIGLTATPSKQTLGFFNRNLVMEYNHAQAVADGVNVDFDVYRINTRISEHGSAVEAGFYVDKRDRQTRQVRWEQLDEQLTYGAGELDRTVVAADQIRTIIRTFKEKLPTEIFPGRKEVPKTLIFAKDDSHADDIVQIVREEFGKGNDFAQKITYRTGSARSVEKKKREDGTEYEEVTWVGSGVTAEHLLSQFRNSYDPRIAVTVDMIATGTDIRPLEIVFFMRSVRSRTFFEQMKGRGSRIISPDDLQAVTPDAGAKTRFVLIDAVGLCEQEMSDSKPLDRQPTVPLGKLLDLVGYGCTEKDVLSTLASRLARLEQQLTKADEAQIEDVTGGLPLKAITRGLVDALDPDVQLEAARSAAESVASGSSAGAPPAACTAPGAGVAGEVSLPPGSPVPDAAQIAAAAAVLLKAAVKPLASNPKLREVLKTIMKANEQVIDTVSTDEVTVAQFSPQARERASNAIQSFEKFIRDNRDEITALQAIYSRPFRQRPTLKELKELANALKRPPLNLPEDHVWAAYRQLDGSRVRGQGGNSLADLVSLVRFALGVETELRPYKEDVEARYDRWMAQQAGSGRLFTDEQRQWLENIRDQIAGSLSMEIGDFDFAPFVQEGGLGRAIKVFGPQLLPLVNELNEVLVA